MTIPAANPPASVPALSPMRALAAVRSWQLGDKLFRVLCQGAAIRFLLTRLFDWLNTPQGALVTRKDPLEYWRRLRFHLSAKDGRSYGL